MSDPTPTPPARSLPILAGVGALVILLGFGLPQLLTPRTPEPTAPATEPAAATNPAPTAPPVPGPSPGLGMSLLRLVVSLVVVCGLCVLATRFLGRRPPAETGAMELLASLAVGPRCAVHLVRAGGRRLLIGIDPGGVKSLVELPGPEPEPASVEPAASPADTAGPVVVGPVAVPVPPLDHDEILTLLARLRATAATPATPPG